MTDHSNQDQELQAFVQNHDWESAQSLDEPLEESVSPLKMVMGPYARSVVCGQFFLDWCYLRYLRMWDGRWLL